MEAEATCLARERAVQCGAGNGAIARTEPVRDTGRAEAGRDHGVWASDDMSSCLLFDHIPILSIRRRGAIVQSVSGDVSVHKVPSPTEPIPPRTKSPKSPGSTTSPIGVDHWGDRDQDGLGGMDRMAWDHHGAEPRGHRVTLMPLHHDAVPSSCRIMGIPTHLRMGMPLDRPPSDSLECRYLDIKT